MAFLDELKLYNPKLYWDAYFRGKIPQSHVSSLVWGQPASAPFLESILQGPKPPNYTSIPIPGDYDNPTAFAESGNYPKPWRSAAQFTQNAQYTNIGPYACFIGFVDCDSSGCVGDTCTEFNKNHPAFNQIRIFGRWGLATSGPNSAEGAFFIQDWHSPGEGTYDAHFWNTYFADAGNPLDPEWQLRKDWWESINKVTVETYFGNTGLKCKIELAQSFFEFGTPEYFAGIDLAVYPDFSLDLLVAMVAIAAIARWL